MPRTTTSLFESIGVYLPPKRMTTREVIEGCKNPVRVPLERVTGIAERPRAGDGLYSIDLAIKAVEKCLEKSRHAPEDFDLIVCCNISRYDQPRGVTYEPATSIRLKRQFGLKRAMTLDISNACAGMWTGVTVVDFLIRVGAIQRGLVVSGEYITHLTDTAQDLIIGHMDPQLASLTLGDAGVAVAIEQSPDPRWGILDLDLYTLAKYSGYCIAKESDSPDHVAAMYTDPVKVTTSIVPLCAAHALMLLEKNQLSLGDVRYIIPHQTSKLTMQDAVKEITRTQEVGFGDRLINNLTYRGNTSSNTHFLAIHDTIQDDIIQSEDLVLFSISGSGQTIGAAIYRFDDLPKRLRGTDGAAFTNGKTPEGATDLRDTTIPSLIRIANVATVFPKPGEPAKTLELLESAGRLCLEGSELSESDISLLLSVGTYRSEHLMEPAVAALLAERLNCNVDPPPQSTKRTFAFDIINGSAGFLKGCFLASQWITEGKGYAAMIVASEVENNRERLPERLLGLEEMASATLLEESLGDESGFLAFHFRDFPEYLESETAHATPHPEGKCLLKFHRDADLLNQYLDCIDVTVREFLAEQKLSLPEMRWILPPQISEEFTTALIERLNADPAQIPLLDKPDADMRTSSTPALLNALEKSRSLQSGDLGLFINVGSGIQVGCALYQF